MRFLTREIGSYRPVTGHWVTNLNGDPRLRGKIVTRWRSGRNCLWDKTPALIHFVFFEAAHFAGREAAVLKTAAEKVMQVTSCAGD
jgi:hypothetical protein